MRCERLVEAQEIVVRLHAGALTGPSSNGRTPARHAGNPGSPRLTASGQATPGGSTDEAHARATSNPNRVGAFANFILVPAPVVQRKIAGATGRRRWFDPSRAHNWGGRWSGAVVRIDGQASSILALSTNTMGWALERSAALQAARGGFDPRSVHYVDKPLVQLEGRALARYARGPGSIPGTSTARPCRRTRRWVYEIQWRRFDSFQGYRRPRQRTLAPGLRSRVAAVRLRPRTPSRSTPVGTAAGFLNRRLQVRLLPSAPRGGWSYDSRGGFMCRPDAGCNTGPRYHAATVGTEARPISAVARVRFPSQRRHAEQSTWW